MKKTFKIKTSIFTNCETLQSLSILIINENAFSQLIKKYVAIQIGKQALVLSTEPVFILGGDLYRISQ